MTVRSRERVWRSGFVVSALLGCALAIASLASAYDRKLISTGDGEPVDVVSGEFLVRFAKEPTRLERETVFRDFELVEVRHDPALRFTRVRMKEPDPASRDMERLYARLAEDPRLECVEYNVLVRVPDHSLVRAGGTPPVLSLAAAVPSPADRDETMQPDAVRLALLDTGVAYRTDEEGGNAFYLAAAQDAVEFDRGADIVNDDPIAMDDHSHGTHVAATILSELGRLFHQQDLPVNVALMPVKVLDENGEGTTETLARGVTFSVSNAASIICFGVAYPRLAPASAILGDALRNAISGNVLVVFPAGDEGASELARTARLEGVITVGSASSSGLRAPYSNHGSGLDCLAWGGEWIDGDGNGFPDGILQRTFSLRAPEDSALFYGIGTCWAAARIAALAGFLADGEALGPIEIEALIRSLAEHPDGSGAASLGSGFGVVRF